MKMEKQLAINRFSLRGKLLPMDVLNVVKSFAFDDQITAFIKSKKKKINEQIETAIYSRKNINNWTTETSENWIFMSEDTILLPIEGCNCRFCGNYIKNTRVNMSCTCVQNEDNFEHDDYHQEFDFDDNPGDDYR